MSETRGPLTRSCLVVVWFFYLGLVALQWIDSNLQQHPVSIYFIRVIPLLIFFPGMYRDGLRSFIWLCFVSLLYFMALVERLFANPTEPVSIASMVAVVFLFIASMMYVRWRARELRKEESDD